MAFTLQNFNISGSFNVAGAGIPITYDPHFNYTTLLLTGNGTNNAQNNTFIDSSTNNIAITRNGTPIQGSLNPYGENWSLYTNGTSSYAYLPYSATRSIGTGDFSIECWINVVSQPANYTRIWSHQSNYGLAGSVGVELAFGTVDQLIQILIDGNSTTYYSATYAPSAPLPWKNKWVHIVGARQSGTLRIFVDGVLREATAGATTNINGTSNTSFGTNSQLGGDLTETYISNYRMCIGSVPTLYQTSSTTAGTTIFTPPTTPLTLTSQGASGVQLLLFKDNRFIDNSPNNFAITTVSSPKIQKFGPFSNYVQTPTSYSGYFDGTGDYLTVPSSANFTLPGDFTIECWIYVPSVSQTIQRIFSSNAGPSGGCFFSVGNDIGTGAGAGKLCANGHLVSPYTSGLITAPTAIPTNTWIHAALVRSGSTITIYQNGVSVASATDSATWDFNNGAGVRISGTPWAGTAEDFGGYISNLRVVKGTAVYTSNFTPSTTPLTAITNTSLLLNATNAGIYDGTMMNNVSTVGDSKISTTQSKFGGSSMYFDGNGDYLQTLANDYLNFGTGDFTIECWVYNEPTSAAYPSFIGSITGWSAGASGHRFDNTGYANKFWFGLNGSGGVASGDPFMASSSTFNHNQWYHYALTRSGNTWRMFINGNLENTQTYSGSYNAALGGMRLGYSTWDGANGYWQGYLDDVRITRGIARYTANFTPPGDLSLLAQ